MADSSLRVRPFGTVDHHDHSSYLPVDEDDLGGFRLFVIEVVRAARRLPPQKPSEDELWAKFAKLTGKRKTDGTAGPSFGSARDPGCNVM
jgi:hypothetical protein